MRWRSNTASTVSSGWITSKWAGLGVPVSEIPDTGETGPAYLYNDIAANSFLPTDELRGVIISKPAQGTVTTDEYSTLTYVGGPEGTNVATYAGYVNGVQYGTYNINLVILQVETGSYSSSTAISVSNTGSKSVNVAASSSSMAVSFSGLSYSKEGSGTTATTLAMSFSAPTHEIAYTGDVLGSYISAITISSDINNGIKTSNSEVSQNIEAYSTLVAEKSVGVVISTSIVVENGFYVEKSVDSSISSNIVVRVTLYGSNTEGKVLRQVMQVFSSSISKYNMEENPRLSIPQATDLTIEMYPLLDGKPPASIQAATYVIYNRAKTILLTKILADMVYLNGKLTVNLTEEDTATLAGTLTHECVARTSTGVDFYPLTAKSISFTSTIARIQ